VSAHGPYDLRVVKGPRVASDVKKYKAKIKYYISYSKESFLEFIRFQIKKMKNNK
jgi:hypothetical protein